MDFSIAGILSWVLQSAESQLAAQDASNILLILYVISYLLTKRSIFLIAFLLIETFGHSAVSGSLSSYQFYLGYSFVYSIVYWVFYKKSIQLRTLAGYVTLIVFELIMSLDAIIYAETETFVYNSYTYVIVLIHIYIITSLFKWKRLGRNMGSFIRGLLCVISPSYYHSFFWYNKTNTPKD